MGARKVHSFDNGVGRHNQSLVPAPRHHRRIVAGPHENRGRRTREAGQKLRQKGAFG
jgi:hypothetical protein